MNQLVAVENKTYKIFLVEMDDDDRERVISGVIENVEISQDNPYDHLQVDALLDSARIFRVADPIVTLTAKVKGGTLKYENFLEDASISEPVEDDDDDD